MAMNRFDYLILCAVRNLATKQRGLRQRLDDMTLKNRVLTNEVTALKEQLKAVTHKLDLFIGASTVTQARQKEEYQRFIEAFCDLQTFIYEKIRVHRSFISFERILAFMAAHLTPMTDPKIPLLLREEIFEMAHPKRIDYFCKAGHATWELTLTTVTRAIEDFYFNHFAAFQRTQEMEARPFSELVIFPTVGESFNPEIMEPCATDFAAHEHPQDYCVQFVLSMGIKSDALHHCTPARVKLIQKK